MVFSIYLTSSFFGKFAPLTIWHKFVKDWKFILYLLIVVYIFYYLQNLILLVEFDMELRFLKDVKSAFVVNVM